MLAKAWLRVLPLPSWMFRRAAKQISKRTPIVRELRVYSGLSAIVPERRVGEFRGRASTAVRQLPTRLFVVPSEPFYTVPYVEVRSKTERQTG